MWHKALDKRQSVTAVFVDYAKAFDHVDHSIILQNLRHMGTPEFATQLIHCFPRNRQQRVKIDNVYSDWLKLNGGMPQWS